MNCLTQSQLDEINPNSSEIETLESGVSISTSLDFVNMNPLIIKDQEPGYRTFQSKFKNQESLRTPEHSSNHTVPKVQYPIASNTTSLADDIVTKSFPTLDSSILTTTSPISTVHSNPTPMFITPLSKFQDQESVTAELRTPEHSKHMFPKGQHTITSNTNEIFIRRLLLQTSVSG